MPAEWTHIVVGGPWPERHGLRCREVPQPVGLDCYPWASPLVKNAVVLVESDPINGPGTDMFEAEPEGSSYRLWSCVIDRADLAPIEGEA